ncbi:hypothetical protein M3231_11860 [Neobacillus mesonae]|nr:hypothetical protein [Neobacillus mesonae]
MEKVFKIDGNTVRFKSSAAFVKKYKAHFRRNIFTDLYLLNESISKDTAGNEVIDFGKLDIDLFYDIAWVLAKTADDSILPVEDWLDQFDSFPIDIMPELLSMVTESLQPSTVSKKK